MDRCFVGGRLNNGQVLAGLEHRIMHNRNKGRQMKFGRVYGSLPKHPVSKGRSGSCSAFNLDAVELLASRPAAIEGVEVCYIDPPYGSEQSDYSKMYGFFEHYIKGETAPALQNHSNFVRRNGYEASFRDLLGLAKGFPNVVISYNDSSWASIETILSCVADSFSTVEVVELDYKYKYRGKKKKSESNSVEYLIIAR